MHEGHRQRLLQKLEHGDNLYEHELLEILLFNAYPRRNVNPVAHALLSRFASIKEVLSAGVDELCAVEGVGKNVALYLNCVGRCLKFGNECSGFAVIDNVAAFKNFIAPRFRGKSNEEIEIYFLDKNGRVKRIASFTSNDADSVTVAPDELIKMIAVYKPYGLFAAHNHINTGAFPSAADDDFTKKLQLICSMNNVRLYDHCIYASGDDIYSYYLSNRIDGIIEDYSVANLIKDGKQI